MMCGRFPVLVVISLLLGACISHEPRQLVPSINLSPDNTLFSTTGDTARSGGVDFGFRTAPAEGDTLGNVAELPGVQVRSVSPGSPADMAGIISGDVILAIDQREINHPDLLDAIALEIDEARTLRAEVRRDTAVFTTILNVSPDSAAQAEAVELYRSDPILLRAGFTTELLDSVSGEDLSGARIVRLFPESPLVSAGFREDDIILSVNEQLVASAQGLVSHIHRNHQPGDQLTLSYTRAYARADEGDYQVYHQTIELWHPGRRLSRLSLWPLWVYESSLDPDRTRFTLGDLWLFSLFSYNREAGEREYSILGLFRTATGYGELLED